MFVVGRWRASDGVVQITDGRRASSQRLDIEEISNLRVHQTGPDVTRLAVRWDR